MISAHPETNSENIFSEKELKLRIESEFDRTGGIFRLAPCWVGRPAFLAPGRRMKLLKEYISHDVAVTERWLASTMSADNGQSNSGCPMDHGLSYLVVGDVRIQLREALAVCGELLLGPNKQWDVLAKLFDYQGRLPHHLHPCDCHVRKGRRGKPESYYFPVELNASLGRMPQTTVGIAAGVSDRKVLEVLGDYFKRDNCLGDFAERLNLSLGTGWYMPPCTLHGPGGLVTYELQVASGVGCMPESRLDDRAIPPNLLDRDLPVTVAQNGEDAVFEYILEMVNCSFSGNRADFRKEYFRPAVSIREEDNCRQDYIIYRCGRASVEEARDLYSAKHTTIPGKRSWRLSERGAFGTLVLGGHGILQVPGKAAVKVESPSLFLDRTEMSGDEVFVAAAAAERLNVECHSVEGLSLYQHFASETNEDSAKIPIPVSC